MIGNTFLIGTVCSEFCCDRIPFSSNILLRLLRKGLTAPATGLDSKEVLSFQCQRRCTICTFVNGLRHGHRSQNSCLFHISDCHWCNRHNKVFIGWYFLIPGSIFIKIIILLIQCLPFTLVGGTNGSLFSTCSEIVLFFSNLFPAGNQFSFLTRFSLFLKIEPLRSYRLPAGLQISIFVKTVPAAMDFRKS